MTTQQIEVAVARKFGARQNIIVPNVSWGMNIHECDLMIIRPSGFAVEVEIKTSMSDLKKDFLKKHKHESVMIKEFYYAFPKEMLEKGIKLIPEKAGIIICENKIFRYHYDNKPTLRYIRAEIYRKAKTQTCRKLSDKEIYNIARLGTMRIWDLKDKLNKINQRELL